MKTKVNLKKGVSLIVLVITIIVMIILAAAIILALSNSGIIGKANKAKTDSDTASLKEYVNTLKSEWLLDEAKIKDEDNTITSFSKYAEKKLSEEGYKTDGTMGAYVVTDDGALNTLYVEGDKTVVIPEDFTYLEGTISGGVVIKDSKDNEFVWVPVEDFSKFERTTTYHGKITSLSERHTEPFSKTVTIDDKNITLSLENDLTGEWAEWTAMRKSVEKYGGFYIGRYEAGSTTERISGKENGTTEVVVKKGMHVYNCVFWGENMISTKENITSSGKNQGKGVVELSRDMYKSSNSIVSTLCYGVQWDAALTFISKTDPEYAKDSTGKGNYTGKLALTGSSEEYKVCNIYDMAGNVHERTMEAFDSNARVIRGGDFESKSEGTAAGWRGNAIIPNSFNSDVGFRVTLYLK